MNEEKRNRIAAAITVNAILLIVILVAVLIYQLVTIPTLVKRREQLYREKEELEKKLEEADEGLEYLESEVAERDKAFEIGYFVPED